MKPTKDINETPNWDYLKNKVPKTLYFIPFSRGNDPDDVIDLARNTISITPILASYDLSRSSRVIDTNPVKS